MPRFELICHYFGHSKCYLTLCDSACSTGLSEAVALAHWTAKTHIHKSLSGRGQGGSSRQHHPHSPTQQFLYFPEQQAAKRDHAVF